MKLMELYGFTKKARKLSTDELKDIIFELICA